MVRTDELPTDEYPNIPNQSCIIINGDKVELYLYADSYRGFNGQVGYISLQNILIKDNRDFDVKIEPRIKDFMKWLIVKEKNLEVDSDLISYARDVMINFTRFLEEDENDDTNEY